MYNVSLFGIVTINPLPYNEYILPKIILKARKRPMLLPQKMGG
jgi:hypothetical protein